MLRLRFTIPIKNIAVPGRTIMSPAYEYSVLLLTGENTVFIAANWYLGAEAWITPYGDITEEMAVLLALST